MIRSSADKGRYATGETDVLIGTVFTDLGIQSRGVIFAHGSGSNASDSHLRMRYLWRLLGRRASIHCGDYGLETWGSDVVVDRIGQGIDFLETIGVQLPVALVGQSMGGCSVLNYALRFPEKVACVALGTPLVDIANIRANPAIAASYPAIDAIYGAPPAADYTDHSPILFAGDLDADLPIRIWYASNDTLIPPATINAFVTARPQTEATDVGALGHTDAPIVNNVSEIVRWINQHL